MHMPCKSPIGGEEKNTAGWIPRGMQPAVEHSFNYLAGVAGLPCGVVPPPPQPTRETRPIARTTATRIRFIVNSMKRVIRVGTVERQQAGR